MNLRATFPSRQLLSATLGALLLATTSPCLQAQAPAPAAAAVGADYVLMKPPVPGGAPRVLQGVLVIGTQGSRVMIRDASGEIGYELAQVQELRKAAPPEFSKAQQLIEAGKLDEAVPLIKSIAGKYKGLPTVWAQDATGMLGNLLISLGQLSEAEAAISAFEAAYKDGGSSTAVSLGKARIAAAKGRFSEAKTIAEPIVADALKQKVVTRAQSQIFGQAYFVLGQCAEGEKKLPEAMEHYARTVAIFYQERSIVAEAQKRIDDLRKNGVTTP